MYFRDIYSTKCYGQMSKKKSLSFPLLKFWAYMENNRDNINFPSFSGFLILNGTPILNGFDFFFFYILWYDKKSVSWTCAWLTDCRNFPRWDMLQILCRQIFCRLFIFTIVTWNHMMIPMYRFQNFLIKNEVAFKQMSYKCNITRVV